MAATPLGTRLTDAHRTTQSRLAALTMAEHGRTWRLLDPGDLDATTPSWLRATLPMIASRRRQSQLLAAAYSKQFRAAEIGDAPLTPAAIAAPVDLDRVAASLVITGPTAVKAAIAAGADLSTAMPIGLVRSAGAAMRHALDGGRSTIVAIAEADPAAHGYRRVASPGCCAFCALLAARNYDGLSSGYFKAHDHCHCQPETAYHASRGSVPRQSREFAALYHDAADGVVGGSKAKLNAFRRALEAQRN